MESEPELAWEWENSGGWWFRGGSTLSGDLSPGNLPVYHREESRDLKKKKAWNILVFLAWVAALRREGRSGVCVCGGDNSEVSRGNYPIWERELPNYRTL